MEIRSNRDMEQPQQGLEPAGKHQQGEPQSVPGIGERGANLRVLDGVVLMDMIDALKDREEKIPRRTRRRVVVSIIRGDDGSRVQARDAQIRQERDRLNNLEPRNGRR
jgi:hypothetical protein